MPSDGGMLIQCYNRGCGQTFDANENMEDSCTYHPGDPFFHDAYKGWSCCKKKCTDFTEFLNIKGCKISYHNNEKPPGSQKPIIDKSNSEEVIVYKASEPTPAPQALVRPAFDSPLVDLKTDISPALEQQVMSLLRRVESVQGNGGDSSEVSVGTSCKNGGCREVYEGPISYESRCMHHPGYPVFHEGLKFWTCCQRRTTDFDTFLNQEGCSINQHVWIKGKNGDQQLSCRYDWHQTAGAVVVSVFAKKYDPNQSCVKLNPVRLKVHLFFPEDHSAFDLDLELRGVVDVSGSSACMLPTKLEVKLRKAEPGSWFKLDFPQAVVETKPSARVEELAPSVDAVDLDAVDLSDL